MPEIDRPKTADYYDDYEGPDRVRPWRDVIDSRRTALLIAGFTYCLLMFSLPPNNVLETVFLWVMVVLFFVIVTLAVLYFPAKWAIRFVLKR